MSNPHGDNDMSWNIQEQEDRDYQMGSASEQQNAYAMSSMGRKGDDPRIVENVKGGRFVVVASVPQFCRFTDASLPSWQDFLSAHDTREEANAALLAWNVAHPDEDEICAYILPYPPREPVVDDGSIPF